MKVVIGFAMLAALIPADGHAHSQLFMRAQARVIADASRYVTEIRGIWRFEPVSSAAIIKEFDGDRNGRLDDSERADIASAVRARQSPFTAEAHFVESGHHVSMSPPSAVRVDLVGEQLVVGFSLKPLEVTRATGRLALWLDDAKKNTIIDFEHDADLAASGSTFENCVRSIVKPGAREPSSQTLATDMFFGDPGDRTRSPLNATRLELDCGG